MVQVSSEKFYYKGKPYLWLYHGTTLVGITTRKGVVLKRGYKEFKTIYEASLPQPPARRIMSQEIVRAAA